MSENYQDLRDQLTQTENKLEKALVELELMREKYEPLKEALFELLDDIESLRVRLHYSDKETREHKWKILTKANII